MWPSLIRNANYQWTETCSTRNKLQSLSIPPHPHTHRQLDSARKQGQRWRAEPRKWQRRSAGGHHCSGAKKVRRRCLGRALSWPRVLGLQRLDSVTVSLFVFLFLIWQRVQSGTFCNDTQSRPRIIRKHDQSKISPKGTQLTQGAWPAKTTSQSVSLFAIDQGQRLSESTIKTTNNEKRTYAEIDIFEVTTNISWFLASKPLLSMGFPWFLGHSTIDFSSHVPSVVGRRDGFDGSFTSNFHWHCFWTFLNELL